MLPCVWHLEYKDRKPGKMAGGMALVWADWVWRAEQSFLGKGLEGRANLLFGLAFLLPSSQELQLWGENHYFPSLNVLLAHILQETAIFTLILLFLAVKIIRLTKHSPPLPHSGPGSKSTRLFLLNFIFCLCMACFQPARTSPFSPW